MSDKPVSIMWRVWLSVLLFVSQECLSQDEDEGPYRGKLIGKLNSYHHQVSGDVYAVDDWTILLVNFNYDGTGDDTFFWAGDSGRPGPQGFIIPDEHGKTNVLERYYDATVRLALPEGKRVSRLRWLCVWDLSSGAAFADVIVPDDFAAPAPRRLAALQPPAAAARAVRSQPLQLLDSATILIPELYYDGSGTEVYFWIGVGPQPSAHGTKIPDEYGYLEPLRAYNGTDVRLRLPGGGAGDAAWLALWDVAESRALASVLLPAQPNVPPALTKPHPYKSSLPHCRQLHRSVQVSWEVFGNAITFQLAAQLRDNEYVAFGISPSRNRSEMIGADIALARLDTVAARPLATDYNITAQAPCVQVLGQWRGVCRDDLLGGQDSNQPLSGSNTDGLTVITYRRDLKPVETMDLEWSVEGPMAVVWAVGAVDEDGAPGFHRLYPRRDVLLTLAATPPVDDCVPFDRSVTEAAGSPWERAELFDPSLRVFRATLGPAGGRRGAGARGVARVWYINGQMTPDLQLRRGLTYTFLVSGGADPHSAELYHPLMVSAERRGGLERLPERAQRAAHTLAGVSAGRRRLSPTAAGPLCLGEHGPGADGRRDDDYPTFRAFNRSLVWRCQPGEPHRLVVQPDTAWPDLVYYHSFTHADMGGRIFIVDRHKRALGRKSAAAAAAAPPLLVLALLLATAGLMQTTC